MKQSMRSVLLALGPIWLAGLAVAQDAPPPQTPTEVEELVVTGEVVYRNRTEEVVPTLSYDLEYFQRFEPLTAGDALKRVPSVAFLSDVLESDGVRLRGLDPGYTQILINGERVPGAGLDRSFFVDRIPAELIERVEVVRSASANRSGDALAGAINIVLRDALSLDGGYLRAGGLYFTDENDDGEFKSTVGGVYGGALGPGRILVGANAQGRRNPKAKLSARFDEPGGELDNVEVQSDVRDGTDYSLNLDYRQDFTGGDFGVDGFFIRTDRLEDEDSIEYAEGQISNDALQTINDNDVDIQTDNWALRGRLGYAMFGGETRARLGYSAIDDEQDEFETEVVYDDDDLPFPDADVLESTLSDLDIEDREWQARLSHQRALATGVTLEFGVDYTDKQRETSILEAEAEIENEVDGPAPIVLTPGAYGDFEAVAGGLNTIEERRIDPYVQLNGESGAFKWEAGLRYETTDVDVEDLTADDEFRNVSNDYDILLPSAHLRYALTAEDRFSVSLARTVRRPNFNQISPAVLEGEFGDNDFVGNPGLNPETAYGIDVGYERRIGRRGVFGVNVFYRDVTDLIEIFNTGAFSDEALGNFEDAVDDGATQEEAAEELTSFVLSARNTGDAKVYGIEFDLSTPLDFVGLPDTGVFANYSWLDSEVNDEFGERRFNDQAEFVFNVGFIHDLRAYGAAFGATYRKQGDAFGRVVGEEITTEYGADLEIFVEKRFGERFVLRFTGSNLLDATKDEFFNKFNTIQDQRDRDFDEYEVETEEAGPVYQLVGRYAF